ncbi:hypothetical protein GOBAR_AA18098 [Gossypium barbadense]|uniref:Uncharacterized protein n=1 Tax=Gossypium barbadense TaxID=3634 RepID=A0A2P5XGU0_GOSBA|nr:hypothetical protein GOBAR_AA18098 [Gossypium barbadense]
MTVRYSRVEVGHDIPKAQDAINHHGRAAWPWVNLIGEHGHGNEKQGRARGKARFYFFDTGVRLACAINLWTIIHGRVAGHDLNCKIRKTRAHLQRAQAWP